MSRDLSNNATQVDSWNTGRLSHLPETSDYGLHSQEARPVSLLKRLGVGHKFNLPVPSRTHAYIANGAEIAERKCRLQRMKVAHMVRL